MNTIKKTNKNVNTNNTSANNDVYIEDISDINKPIVDKQLNSDVYFTAYSDSKMDINLFPESSSTIRLGGNSQPNIPSWATYGNMLSLVSPGADTAVQILSGYDNDNIGFRSGNKKTLPSRDFVKFFHENNCPTADQVGAAVALTNSQPGSVYNMRSDGSWAEAINDAPHDNKQYVRENGNWTEVTALPNVGDGEDKSLWVEASSMGIIYNDAKKAAANASILKNAAAKQVVRLAFTDNVYFDTTAGEIVIRYGLELHGCLGKKIHWVGSPITTNSDDCLSVMTMPNVAEMPYYCETNCFHVTTGKLTFIEGDGWGGYRGIISRDCNYDGSFRYKFFGKEQHPTKGNPNSSTYTFKGDYAGFGEVIFDNLTLTNSRHLAFFGANQFPYERIVFRNVVMRNCSRGLYSGGITNTNPWYLDVQKAMRNMVVEGLDWENSADFWAGEDNNTAVYVTPLLWEGNRLIYTNARIRGVKVRSHANNKGARALSPVYLGGIRAEMRDCETVNMYNFNPDGSTNTCIFLKKVRNALINNIEHRYEENFFRDMEADFGVTVDNTQGMFISYSPEPGAPWDDSVNYGSEPAESIIIRNAKCWLPKLLRTADISTQIVGSYEITDCDFESPDNGYNSNGRMSGAFTFLTVSWWDNSKYLVDNQMVNRRAIFKGNRVYTPNNTAGKLAYVDIRDMRQHRNGGYVIDISNNDITANCLKELQLTCTSGSEFKAQDCIINQVTLNNRVHIVNSTQNDITPRHDVFVAGNKVPKVIRLDMGGHYSSTAKNALLGRVQQNVFGADMTTGKFRITYAEVTGATPGITLMNATRPSNGCLQNKVHDYNGTMTTKAGCFDFYTRVEITNVNIEKETCTIGYFHPSTKKWTKIEWDATKNDSSFEILVNSKNRFGNDNESSPIKARIGRRSSALTMTLYPNYGDSNYSSVVDVELNINQY
ncbi:hypothetical protein CTM91_12350 [Photobacterium aquimaris]|uniref:hypothetical protein n=1 Tax=Photobacterium aquimaris TaxID=512643 RepID=UPI000D1557E6|nr:hypothetical protein [Photobacterium aquimaris]PSW00359.1 hypothetical protein CTM91_12350 [Photobacterium aquimaris]